MARNLRLSLLLLLVLIPAVAGPAAGTPKSKSQRIHDKIAHLQKKAAKAHKQKAYLTSQISRITGRVRLLETQITVATKSLDRLEAKLLVHERRLNKLNVVFVAQTTRLELLQHEYAQAQETLQARLVAIYEGGQTDAVSIVFSAKSLSDVVDELSYQRSVTSQDRETAVEVGHARDKMVVLQHATKRNRTHALDETKTISDAAWHVRQTRDALARHQHQLSSARSTKRRALETVTESEQELLDEINSLQAASRRVSQQLQSSGSHGSGVSSSGLIWPVNGPVVSPFGMRWGRMHEGIDIAAGYGTPIEAAAGGTVVYAGWEDGYGNFVVIDHGDGLATAYGHQQRIAVANGQSVTQGQLIGYVGCTGHCFGPHLHFEVRVNGTPVDPLRYL
jgi:murein DD-endopeptidase MepM/ murein hydrolase activator NlpD